MGLGFIVMICEYCSAACRDVREGQDNGVSLGCLLDCTPLHLQSTPYLWQNLYRTKELEAEHFQKKNAGPYCAKVKVFKIIFKYTRYVWGKKSATGHSGLQFS